MTKSIIAVLISIVSIQFGATAAKSLFPLVGPLEATLLRLGIASLILLLFLPRKKGRIKKEDRIPLLGYGTSLGFMNICFYLALAKIPLGIAVGLEFIGPLAVALLASQKLADLIWAILAVVGILLIVPSGPLSTTESLDPMGIAFALSAGFFWALYIVFGKKVATTIEARKATLVGMLVATTVVLPAGVVHADLGSLTPKALFLAGIVALLSSALPYTLEMIALQKIPAKTFGILMSLEPAVAALCGLTFLREQLSWSQWSAIGCIMIASLGSTLSMNTERKKKVPLTAAQV